MAYVPDSLNKGDVSAIQATKANLIASVNSGLEHLKMLEQALLDYRAIVEKDTDVNLEYADIFNRWNEPDRHSSTYGLPAVMAQTVATYDREALKKDNQRLAACKDAKEKSERQRDTYFKSIVKSFAALQSDLNNGVGIYNQQLFTYIEHLNKQSK